MSDPNAAPCRSWLFMPATRPDRFAGQVAAINVALTPTPEAVEQARAILAESAKGVGVVDGKMIDKAVARNARRTLAAAGISA